jgi:hypothetical protein
MMLVFVEHHEWVIRIEWRLILGQFFFVIICLPLEFIPTIALVFVNHLEWVVYFQGTRSHRPETTSDASDDTQQF